MPMFQNPAEDMPLSHARFAEMPAFEPLFPGAAPSGPIHAPEPPPDGREDAELAALRQRERAAFEDGRGKGLTEGRKMGEKLAQTRFDAALADIEASIAGLRSALERFTADQAAGNESVIGRLAERLAAPATRPALQALFERHVLDVLRAGAAPPVRRIALAPETLAAADAARPGFRAALAAAEIEIVARAGLPDLRAEMVDAGGARLSVDFAALIQALQADFAIVTREQDSDE